MTEDGMSFVESPLCNGIQSCVWSWGQLKLTFELCLSASNQTKLDQLNGWLGRNFIEIRKEKEKKMEKIGLSDFFVPPLSCILYPSLISYFFVFSKSLITAHFIIYIWLNTS